MSVINRMLTQLDERRAASPEATGTRAAGAVSAVPPPTSRRVGWWVLGGAALVSAAAFGHRPDAPDTPSAPATTPPALPTVAATTLTTPATVPPTAAVTPPPLPSTARPVPDHRSSHQPADQRATAGQSAIRVAAVAVSRSEPRPTVPAQAIERASVVPVAHAPVARPATPPATAAVDSGVVVAMASPTPLPAAGTARADTGSVEKRVIPPSAAQRATQTYRQAISLAASGHGSLAIAQALDALKIDPDHLAARELAVALLMEGQRLGEAHALIRDGLARQPQQPHLIMLLARIEAETGDTQAALERLTAAPALDGDGHGLRAALLARAERYREAASAYDAAVRLQPDNAVWWLGLGVSLDANGQTALSRQALQRARAIGSLRGDALAYIEQKLAN